MLFSMYVAAIQYGNNEPECRDYIRNKVVPLIYEYDRRTTKNKNEFFGWQMAIIMAGAAEIDDSYHIFGQFYFLSNATHMTTSVVVSLEPRLQQTIDPIYNH